MRSWLRRAVPILLGVALLAVPSAASGNEGGSGDARHSLRSPLTGENFYFVMADRFENGRTANDLGGLPADRLVSGFDPTAKGFYHGGDLAGIRQRLSYVRDLGTTAIWLTPSFKNKAVQLEDGPSAGYHGYWITDFTQIDPHLGTNAELAALIQEAHGMGMKVFFDIITNHTADVIDYEEGHRPGYVSKDQVPYRTASGTPFDDRDYAGTNRFPPLSRTESFPFTPFNPPDAPVKVPAWLNDVTLYHNRGNTTFVGENSYYGDFFGLDDLFTEHPRVVRGMIDIYQAWIRDFGIDGFRIDTMKHVDDEFWQRFAPEVLTYARQQGKREFFMFGEVFDTTKSFTSHFTTHDRVQAVLDFPFQQAAQNFAANSHADRRAARLLRRRRLVHRRRLQRLPAAHLPRQPRHGADRALRQGGQRRRRRRRAPGPRPAGPRADVPLARQPGHLLRRRAGLHRRRRRPGRPPGHVPEPGRLLQRRRPDRHRRDHRHRQLRRRPPAVPVDRRAGQRDQQAPGAARRRPAAPVVLVRSGRLRLLATSTGTSSTSTWWRSTTPSRPRPRPCPPTCGGRRSGSSTAAGPPGWCRMPTSGWA